MSRFLGPSGHAPDMRKSMLMSGAVSGKSRGPWIPRTLCGTKDVWAAARMLAAHVSANPFDLYDLGDKYAALGLG